MTRPLITVKTLLAQARDQAVVELPENALITPAAQDWLRSARIPVRRAGVLTAPPAGPAVYFIGDAAQPVVQVLLPQLQREYPALEFLPCHGNTAGLMDALRQACEGLSGCSRRRGVVVVRDGANVSCVANKFAQVRAAILPRPTALFYLMHDLGINLLILEREHLSLQQMRGAIDAFLTGKTSVAPVIEAALPAAPAAGPAENAAACSCEK